MLLPWSFSTSGFGFQLVLGLPRTARETAQGPPADLRPAKDLLAALGVGRAPAVDVAHPQPGHLSASRELSR